jgi:heat shock protein HtpX
MMEGQSRNRFVGEDPQLAARILLTKAILIVLLAITSLGLLLSRSWLSLLAPLELIGAFMAYWYSDRISMFTWGASEVTAAQAPEIHGIVNKLIESANIPKPKIAISDRDIPNAFASGRNLDNSVVCVTRGLQNCINPAEMEAILSHEIAHLMHRDVAVTAFAAIASIMSGLFLQAAMFSAADSHPNETKESRRARESLVFLAFTVYITTLLTVKALSRYRELAADRGGALLTRKPDHLISALTKIEIASLSGSKREVQAGQMSNTLLIVPLMPKKRRRLQELFSTHPSLEIRVENLRKLEAQMLAGVI